MYNLERVQKEFIEICNSANAPCNIPIKLNGRLTRTFGRVKQRSFDGEYWFSELVEFSKQLLETSTDESIRSIIEHEACHYIITYRTHKNHGHDAQFKAVCAEIGCTNNKAFTEVERVVETSTLYKYEVYCPTCDKKISGFSRMCKTLKNIESCYCKKCGGENLKVIQNW